MTKIFRKAIGFGFGVCCLNILLYDRFPRSINLYSYEMKNRNHEEEMWLSAGEEAQLKHQSLIQKMKGIIKLYKSPAFCWNPHISLLYGQTKLGTSFKTESAIGYKREYVLGSEGKIAFDIAYSESGVHDKLVLMIPGVSGASTAGYGLEAVYQLKQRGFTVVVINHIAPRDGENELRLLDFSNPAVLKEAIVHLKQKFGQDSKILGVGFSMGGNHLLRYLGDYKSSAGESGIHAAMTIGNPFVVLATGL